MSLFGIVHGDPLNLNITDLVERLSVYIENISLEVSVFCSGVSEPQDNQFQIAGETTQ